jgi:ribonuclease P protein subunit RPR2
LSRNTFMLKDLAQQRIDHLFSLAIGTAQSLPDLSDRYVEMAQRLSKRTRVKIPHKWKYFICGSCNRFLYPGTTARVRIAQRRSPHTVITCLRCGSKKRYPIKK